MLLLCVCYNFILYTITAAEAHFKRTTTHTVHTRMRTHIVGSLCSFQSRPEHLGQVSVSAVDPQHEGE